MSFFNYFFSQNALLALTLSLCLGYLIGSIKIGKFKLGGVAGSLICGVLISLLIEPVTKNMFVAGKVVSTLSPIVPVQEENILFALFVFSVGYQSGPAFFRSLGKKTIKEIILAFVMAVSGLLTVWGVSEYFHFGKGLAAGVAAGGLTQSAIMGVATDAMSKMNMSTSELSSQTANVGTGYAVTYILGSLVTIFICSNLLSKFMKQSLKKSAEKEVLDHPETYSSENQSTIESSEQGKTNISFLALGLFIGLAIGIIVIRVGKVPVTLGAGGGALLSGLFLGWYMSKKHSDKVVIPVSILQFLSNFGLGGFVAAVGLDSGRTAIKTIETQGFSILIGGLIVTVVPLLITMAVGKWILRYKNAAIFAGALAGSRSANPAFGEILDQAGNSVPTISFAVTYALANVFLTVLGPIIVTIVS